MDIGMVSPKRWRVVPGRLPGSDDTSGPHDTAVRPSSTSSVTPNTALRSGSSKHGKARRALVDSNCVVARVRVVPSAAV